MRNEKGIHSIYTSEKVKGDIREQTPPIMQPMYTKMKLLQIIFLATVVGLASRNIFPTTLNMVHVALDSPDKMLQDVFATNHAVAAVQELDHVKKQLRKVTEELNELRASTAASSAVNTQANVPQQTSSSSKSQFDLVKDTTYELASAPATTHVRQIVAFDPDKNMTSGTGGLNDDDRATLYELYGNADSVFEWGLGESTDIAAQLGVPRYSGIDSHPNWVAQARQQAVARGMNHFRFAFADIGVTGAWGTPYDKNLPKVVYNYQIQPLVGEDKPFDVYLIDGRFRIACFCIAILHALARGGDMEKVRFGFHDSHRKYYKVVPEIAELVTFNKKLRIYKYKPGMTEDDIYAFWDKYKLMQK
eukprot:scaffold4954_cov106-Cylindrotheca_fusiformis.AAC.1